MLEIHCQAANLLSHCPKFVVSFMWFSLFCQHFAFESSSNSFNFTYEIPSTY
jgi:hypothetical protein